MLSADARVYLETLYRKRRDELLEQREINRQTVSRNIINFDDAEKVVGYLNMFQPDCDFISGLAHAHAEAVRKAYDLDGEAITQQVIDQEVMPEVDKILAESVSGVLSREKGRMGLRQARTRRADTGATSRLGSLTRHLTKTVTETRTKIRNELILHMLEMKKKSWNPGKSRALDVETAAHKLPLDLSGDSDDRRFARLAIEEARKSVPEDDRIHPRVGVVVVKDGRVLATAHRGEFPQCHGEFIALEKKLATVSLAGSTVYTTLEPCTSRNHPKVPCATRLSERKVARVVIGMLDPDDRISGRGQRALRKAGIATGLFDHDLMTEIEELNRDFIREKEATEHRSASDNPDSKRSPAAITPETEAARRLSDASRDIEKAGWAYVELHSRYGVAQAVRDVIGEERMILEEIETAAEIFERDYDLPANLARVAKEELANMRISLDRLTSGHDLDSMKIAAEQVQDSCNRVRESAKPYAYLKNDAGEARRVEKLELRVARPIIVPKRYGGGATKDDFGYTGLGVVNDGEQPGYDLTIHGIQLKDGTKLVFHRGHTERLTKSDGEAFYPAFLEARLGGTFGSGLFDFMREHDLPSITVPITYRDSYNNWFQTDVSLERDVQKSGGLRLGWKQKRIPNPDSENG